jgi:hypothetical protein
MRRVAAQLQHTTMTDIKVKYAYGQNVERCFKVKYAYLKKAYIKVKDASR